MGSRSLRRFASIVFDGVGGNRLSEELLVRATSRRFRILAYHGIEDADCFASHLAHLRAHYVPVSVDQVLDSMEGAPLPDRAVWVTFDDGLPSVVQRGVPLLKRWEIPVTLFICPGVVDTSLPLWWQALENLLAAGGEIEWRDQVFSGHSASLTLIAHLKKEPDEIRRRVVAEALRSHRDRTGVDITQPQLTSADLHQLAGAGATVGNHTWDHPCLDTCDPDEQRRQIESAHEYLTALGPMARPVFAYPNGNWTKESEASVRSLGYRIGTLFDHRLTNLADDPLAWSRLRVNSDTDLPRFRAILSGLHSGVSRLRGAGM